MNIRSFALLALAVLIGTSFLSAQMSTDEAMKRLEARRAAAASQPSTEIAKTSAKPVGPFKIRDDAPDSIKEYWKECEQEKVDRIKNARQIISANTKALQDGLTKDEGVINARKESIRDQQALIKTLSAPDFITFVEMKNKSEVGNVGTIRGAKIIQVIDARNCLVNIVGATIHETNPGDPTSIIATPEVSSDVTWIFGPDTAGASDGRNWPAVQNRLFMVTGTKSYDSVLGKKTVPVLEPFDLHQYLTSN